MSGSSPVSNAYREAGVDTGSGQKFVRMISGFVESTMSPAVLRNFGGFAACIDVSSLKQYDEPVLVATTDGVGTKLRLATLFDRHETIGIDLVAMCSNDILVTGAKPLYFLDYIACGKLSPEKMAVVVESIASGCRACGASLVGGETAEHPGLMRDDDYDLAGFMTGVAEKKRLIQNRTVAPGQVLVGIPGSGVHSNGMSLVRRLYLKNGVDLPDSDADRKFLLNEILLRPTIIYEGLLRPLIEAGEEIRGLVHITGGGYYENIPRILPKGTGVVIERSAVPVLPVFQAIAERGKLDDRELFSVFNMGTGMIAILEESDAGRFMERINAEMTRLFPDVTGRAAVIGKVVENDGSTERVRIG